MTVSDGSHDLTPRERQILRLMADGYTAADIGVELGISRETARTHTERIRIKLHASNAPNVVAKAFRLGILS